MKMGFSAENLLPSFVVNYSSPMLTLTFILGKENHSLVVNLGVKITRCRIASMCPVTSRGGARTLFDEQSLLMHKFLPYSAR